MNKYLLLRDNKQSGPYTVPEIIEKGIKPYDLVWLEGRSAAWRYPSEIEELKAYAPAVEEQPFDRFYKKPEKIQEKEIVTVESSANSRFEPKPVSIPVVAETSQPAKKAYVNFPASGATSPSKSAARSNTPVLFPERKPIAELTEAPAPAPVSSNNTNTPRYPARRSSDTKLLYGAIAACFIMMAFITVFIVNYNKQRRSINELSMMVQQMEQDRQKQAAPEATATTVNQGLTDQQQPSVETGVVEPLSENPAIPKRTNSNKANTVIKTPLLVENGPSAEELAAFTSEELKKSETKAPPAENLFKLVTVKSNKYKTGVLGGISNLTLELTNNSLHALQRVSIEIKYLGPEKKIVRTQTVFFENVSPGAQLTLDVPKSKRGVTVDYSITDIKS